MDGKRLQLSSAARNHVHVILESKIVFYKVDVSEEKKTSDNRYQSGNAKIQSDLRSVVALAILGYAYITGVLALLICACILVAYFLYKWHSIYVIKLAIIPLLLLLAIIKSFVVKIDPPDGLEVKDSDAPELFKLISEVRAAAQSPLIHRVVLTSEFNCAVAQIPLLGTLGFYRNYLILGLPLMGAMTVDQFKAVLAHEMGHLSARHGRTGCWIYHVQKSWLQLVENISERGGIGILLFKSFLTWFLPLFEEKALGIFRLQEYEADQLAAQLVGSKTCAQALALSEVRGMYLSDKFWPAQLAKTKEIAEPPRGLIAAASSLAAGSIADGEVESYFQMSDDNYDENGTHPKLRDRIKALGIASDFSNLLELFKAAESCVIENASAANKLLGDAQLRLIDSVEELWRKDIIGGWTVEYESCKSRRELLRRLDNAAHTDSLSIEDLIQRADLTAFFDEEGRAIEMLRDLLATHPNHAELRFRLGNYLLERDDEEGLLHLEKSLTLGRKYSFYCYQALYNYYTRKKEHERAQENLQKANEAAQKLVNAAIAAMTVTADETFGSHDASSFKLDRIKSALYAESRVRQAYLVKRAMVDRDLLDGGEQLLVLQLGSPGRMLLSEEDLLAAIPSLAQVPELSEFSIIPVQHGPRKLRDTCIELPDALIYDRKQYEAALAESGAPMPRVDASKHLPKRSFLKQYGWSIAALIGFIVVVMLMLSDKTTEPSSTANSEDRNRGDSDAAGVNFDSYINQLQREMKWSWHPPAYAKRCQVSVFFKVHSDGHYSDFKILKSSGNDAMDQAARAAVSSASPFERLPAGAPENVDIEFTFAYNAKKQK